ncbi:TIR domain-containing protein [Actinoplanes subglobosus]|uniref:TIR domain-containing protein n=1 Tax=Actinoplanes subglobosus TaxID=1547892 RepID=A0ABV8IYM8_9ACTN
MSFNGFISYSHAADGKLAPAVQRGLHRLAKPWHRRRALWIFRDQTGLSVTPGLWSSIQKALDGSEWFVLLASPAAARSPWVNREIEYWIATKPADRILPVVTDGEWRWDARLGDLSADSTAVPDALRGVFAEEPLFLDLRWVHDDQRLNLRDIRFRDAIAELAAPMHGVSKDELESEDLRHHRQSRRLRRMAVAAVALLTAVASGTAVLADHNADRATAAAVEAQRQQQDASHQRGEAERYAEEAGRQKKNAQTQEARAHAATEERLQQEKRARELQASAQQAAAEARRQEKAARRQQELAARSQSLARQQEAVAREQRELAQQAARETASQRIIAEQQQRLAEEAAAETERQRNNAQQQQRMAEEAAAEADRQKAIAEQNERMAGEAAAEADRQKALAEQNERKAGEAAAEADRQKVIAEQNERKAGEAAAEADRQKILAEQNERKAGEAAAEARRQEANAEEQKKITAGRRLINQAKATMDNDPVTALRLGIAAQRIQPGTEARTELAGIVSSVRRAGTMNDAWYAAHGPGDVVAVVESEFNAALWSVADRADPVRLAPLDGFLFTSQPVFSPDGKLLAIAGDYALVPHLFDVSDPAHPKRVGTVPSELSKWNTFSPDGTMLGTVDYYGVWSLWDVTDPARPTMLTQQTGGYPAPLAFSPDSRSVVTAGAPGTVWDITDRTRPQRVATLPGSWARAVANPVRPLLATSDKEGTLAFWNLADPAKPQRGATTSVRAHSMAFSPDGRTMASGDDAGMTRLWDLTDTPVPMIELNDQGGSPRSMSFSQDSRILSVVGSLRTLSLWNAAAHGEPTGVGQADGTTGQTVTAALTPDGRRLTTVHADGTATIWDVSDRTHPVARGTVRIRDGGISMAAVSPTGDVIAASGMTYGERITFTDVKDPGAPKPLGWIPGWDLDSRMTFSPDGRTLAIDIGAYTVMLWDVTDPSDPGPVTILDGVDWVDAIAFSPDGRTVAVGEGRSVVLWDLTDRGNPVRGATLKGHADAVLAAAFSPDGRTLVTGSADRTAAVWTLTGRPRRQAILTGTKAAVWSVAFGPDGRTLMTGSKDGAVAFWDVGEPSGPIRMASMRRAALGSKILLPHPDGRTLTADGGESGVRRAALWDYTALTALRDEPAAAACVAAGGGFTADEWDAYIPEMAYQPTCPA